MRAYTRRMRLTSSNRPAVIANVLVLSAVSLAVSAYFVHEAQQIGVVIFLLGLACLASLKLFSVRIRSVQPDIIFGVIDNGILALFALFGAELAGTAGAVIGGAVGNAVTDGIAGLFEGYWAERTHNSQRTVLGSAVGKMAGCLLGAGAVLALGAFVLR